MKTIAQTVAAAARPRTLAIGVSSVLGGMAAAATNGNFEFLSAILCLLLAVFLQLSANIYQKYYESLYVSMDVELVNVNDSRIYSRVALRESARALLILSCTVGLSLMTMGGWWTLIIAFLLGIIFLLYNTGRHPLYRSVWALLVTFIVFGPIATIGTSLIQSQHTAPDNNILNWYDLHPAVTMCFITGLMACNFHIIGYIGRIREDLDNNRNSIVIQFGKKNSLILFLIFVVIYTLVGIFASIGDAGSKWWVYCILPILNFFVNIYIGIAAFRADKEKIIKLKNITAICMLVFNLVTLILMLCVGIDKVTPYEYF